ncbi:DUF1109 domain-containing protein [Caulobacter segnis]|uniref:DUF1109 domain-containing protein n=2 Tax=Caulobacter segnis TaxID=88688 RepID=D5VEN4_CAUST|nr:anti-sigma-F factor NrsF [Caulobacter segnis]ADG09177.1 protein of unknown function DUF1109 [Caulobacter segnis ATCC 21756]AVQ00992.1 DUF1109 domain-containing protein [Caulobacter segnis]
MRTDDLIAALAADGAPVRTPRRRLAVVAVAGALVALVLVLTWLHTRHDLMPAMRGGMFWMKAAYTAVLGLAGYLAIERLARPEGSGRRGWLLGGAVVAVFVVAGVWQALVSPDVQAALHMLRGHSWHSCSRNILVLGLPMLALGLLAVRSMAPTRPVAAGFATGLFAGGVAATVYGLHCAENTFTFVALWYSLGVLLLAALGAVLGRWVLRW